MLTQIVEDVYCWQALQIELKRYINGYLFMTRIGPILVDPPSAAEPIIRDIERLGKPRAILLTGRHQVRRARQYQGWYNAKVFAPEADRKLLQQVKPDALYKPGDTLPGGFRPITPGNQRSPGESALYHAASKTLVASHLVGEPEGYVQMQEKGIYWNFSRAFEAQLQLLDVEFETLLPGRGKPIVGEGRVALAKYLAGYEA